MNANVRRYLIAVGLLARVALSAAGAPAQEAPDPTADVASSAYADKAGTLDDSGPSKSVTKSPAIALYRGEVQVLDLSNVTRIAVGNGQVLRANVVASDQVVLIAEKPGSSSLRVWTRDGEQFNYDVKVREFDIAQIFRDVQDLLAAEPGISARQVDGRILIEGNYSTSKAASRLEALQRIYPTIISTVALPDPKKRPSGVALDKMVYMDVRVVEILKSSLRRLGVNWQQKTNGGVNMGFSTSTAFNAANAPGAIGLAKVPTTGLFGIAANLSSQLDVLEQTGESWTLAEPTVSCKSGGEAKFTVGGEIPVPVAAGLGVQSVVYKQYGVILEFKPIADDNGNVSSSIVAEVSQPDQTFSNANGLGLIAFVKTRTETDVSLKENQTLVISGLLKNDGNREAHGIPGAKDIPVLGNLFKSKQYQNDRTELVVLVTPRAINAQSDINTAAIHEADRMQAHVDPVINVINSKLAE